ncbi:MAG: aminodeoxychorismate synthase component I [Woeseiaceae bacterium]|nr:aminodeoxychorismate synthase component I [Woeseiaceae bacterium]
MLRRSVCDRNYSVAVELDEHVDLRALRRAFPERYPCLLESTARNETLGRFDILFACPGEELVLTADGLGGPAHGDSFLAELDQWWLREQGTNEVAFLPFTGGWFVYLGYELAGEIEPQLRTASDPDLPVAFALRCRAAVVREALNGRCWLVYEHDVEEQVPDIVADVAASTGSSEGPAALARIEEEPEHVFLEAVNAAKEYIAAGDIYQANLSRQWTANYGAAPDAMSLYAALAESNPAPFAGVASHDGATIISSSPERLLKLRDGIASTRPIAGTRPRAPDHSTDHALSKELFAHPKERAEHVMLIDLERNDLGRVCRPGTVVVDEMMVLESYAHVHHIVSNVRGELRDDVTPGAAIRAVFPGGTITGCPKVRCMEIISELENGPRGAYTGSMGYLNRDGSLDLNILIRTMVLRENALRFRAGAGIVADSDPVAELGETRAKAKGLRKAIDP